MDTVAAKKISTSALAKKLGLTGKELFQKMESAGWITRADNSWSLTESGKSKGGEYTTHPKYGTYICWPDVLVMDDSGSSSNSSSRADTSSKPLTSSAIGQRLELSAQKVNAIFSELGWVDKALKGWHVTPQGKALGGLQREDYRTGVPFVCWPEDILGNKALVLSLKEVHGDLSQAIGLDDASSETQSFRDQFPATLRTTDGHMVRSKAEMLIDNWLYMAEIVHAYERKLPIEEEMYCDFYIPTGKVYIEYWGYENDARYLERKKQKLALYKKYGFKLIELNDDDVKNLDDVLPRMLLKHGVQTY
ncbi:glycerol kinase [Parendozoicomonas haliclonae]|uniref:Phage antirepressor protein KilAC domain protein n=1 Tax=Parendozoicomonas haliclonae TaxID=1960125 RepID=A0A1X7AHB4_9GAMM|nr:glycerol kinase [Parendozoicomonas haliclonae]SMA42041.1 Phage antirepressor protein KilAC domain protein [Parendozoicomonas haliclonae]